MTGPNVRSVTARLDAEVAAYIAKMKAAGKATSDSFDSARTSIRGANDELKVTNTHLQTYRSRSLQATRNTDLLTTSMGKLNAATRLAGPAMTNTASASDRATRSFDRTGHAIDRTSGRLALLLKFGAAVGPGAIPFGGVAIAGIAGLASQFGFAAAAAETAVIAFQGIGDTLKAVNQAALEPTAANLKAAREAMQALSPAGRDLVRQLQEMKPLFTELRNSAAEGLFPGVIRGFESLEQLAPRVNSLISEVADTLGDIFAEGASSLSSDRWADFFTMLEAEARPVLTDLASTIGSFAHGLGELWQAFAPLNRDFGSWMADVAGSFDQWAQGLSQTDGFREFIDYIRTNGPLVGEAVVAISNALLQIVEAAAPLGGPVLQAITGIADAIALIADSPFGTPILAAVTAMSALSLASAAATAAVTRLNAAMATLGVTSKATGAAAATGVGAAGAGAAASGGAGAWAAPLLLGFYSIKQAFNNTSDLIQGEMPLWEYSFRSLVPATNILEDLGVNIGFLGDEAEDTRLPLREFVDAALAGFEQARHFGKAVGYIGDQMTGNLDATSRADRQLQHYNQTLRANRDAARQAAEGFVDFGHTAKASEFTLDGWLDKIEQQTQAMRDFRENAIEAGNKGLDQGLIQHLREMGTQGALQLRRLANASETQIARANKDWKAFQRESRLAKESVDAVQRAVDIFGHTDAKAKVSVKGAAEAAAAAARVQAQISMIDTNVLINIKSSIQGSLNPFFDSGGYTGDGPKHEVAGVVHRGEVVLPAEIVQRDRGMLWGRYGHLPGMASGGLAGASRSDTLVYTRSSDNAVEQWSRQTAAALKSLTSTARETDAAWRGRTGPLGGGGHNGNFFGIAGGGPAGGGRFLGLGGGGRNGSFSQLEIELVKAIDRFRAASRELRQMEKALDRAEKAVDRQRQIVDDAFQAVQDTLRDMQSFSDSIQGRLTKGLFENGTDFASVAGVLQGNEAGGNLWAQSLLRLQSMGLDGPALKAILEQVSSAEDLAAVAAWTPEQIRRIEQLFASSTAATGTAGGLSAEEVFKEELALERQVLVDVRGDLAAAQATRKEAAQDVRESRKLAERLGQQVDHLNERVDSIEESHPRRIGNVIKHGFDDKGADAGRRNG